MAKKLLVNVSHGGVAYGPDYPENKVSAEVRKALQGREGVWDDGEDDEDELGARPGPDGVAARGKVAEAAVEQGQAEREAEGDGVNQDVDPKAARHGTKVTRSTN